jgi:hypothetical protein
MRAAHAPPLATNANMSDIDTLPSTRSSTDLETVYQKVTRRVVFLLFVCYLLAYLDRINIGYAQLQMRSELNFWFVSKIYGRVLAQEVCRVHDIARVLSF